MPEPDEIDQVLEHAVGDGLVLSTLGQKVDLIRAYLKEAGFAIVVDEAQALERGREGEAA